MSKFSVGDDVWVDASDTHFGHWMYSDVQMVKSKVVQIDAIMPDRMLVSHDWQASSGMRLSLVDAKLVFHKRSELIKYRASKAHFRVGDLVSILNRGRQARDKTDPTSLGTITRITKSYIHLMTDEGSMMAVPEQCLIVSRPTVQEKKGER